MRGSVGREPPFRRLLLGSCAGRVDVSAATSTLTDDVGEEGGGSGGWRMGGRDIEDRKRGASGGGIEGELRGLRNGAAGREVYVFAAE